MGWKKVEDTATKNLEGMVNKGRDVRGFIAKYLRPKYRDHQRKRFDSENMTEGPKWSPLNADYAKLKLKKFANFPGGGRKINVATGKMYFSLTLQKDFNELITDKSWIVIFNVQNERGDNYIKYVNEARPVLQFRDEFTKDVRQRFVEYMRGK